MIVHLDVLEANLKTKEDHLSFGCPMGDAHRASKTLWTNSPYGMDVTYAFLVQFLALSKRGGHKSTLIDCSINTAVCRLWKNAVSLF